MVFLARLLRFVFWLLVVSWSASILRRIVARMGQGGTEAEQPGGAPNDAAPGKLVRDPVCGMHVAEALALPLREGTEIVHFCSAECREKYLSGSKKFAANG